MTTKLWDHINCDSCLYIVSGFAILITIVNIFVPQNREATPNVFSSDFDLTSSGFFIFDLYERFAHENALKANINSVLNNIFEDVHLTYPISHLMMGRNGVIYPELILRSKKCVVYSAGVSNFEFETYMANVCEVHFFDCTKTKLNHENIIFHNQCIGQVEIDKATLIPEKPHFYGPSYNFNSTMSMLGHIYVDFLKLDTKGSEWQIIEDLLNGFHRPRQLLFRLHTYCSKISKEFISDKTKDAVNQLFVQLYQEGYRLVGKNVDLSDQCSAVFYMIYRL